MSNEIRPNAQALETRTRGAGIATEWMGWGQVSIFTLAKIFRCPESPDLL
jgi:hypothetical protein